MPICARFRYATSSNLKKTSAEIDEINAAFPISDSYNEFMQKQGVIYTEFGVKALSDVNDLEDEKRQELEAKLDELKEEYSDAIDEQNAVNEEKRSFLDEEIDINLKMIKIDDMPDIAEDNMYPHWEIWRVIELLVIEE
jgi:hypothetical protein